MRLEIMAPRIRGSRQPADFDLAAAGDSRRRGSSDPVPSGMVAIIARGLAGMLLATSIGCVSPRPTVAPSLLDCAAQVGASDLADRRAKIDRACLRLGPIGLGMSRDEVEKALGPAALELREPANCTNAVYVVSRSSAQAGADVGTLRVVYQEEKVAAVETQGAPARNAFGFDRVRVDDGAIDVRRALGPPHAVLGQVWSYLPVFFLLDDGSQKVEAIAVSESEAAFACLLPATLQVSCESETRVTVVRPPNDEVRLHGLRDWPGTIIRRSRTCKR